MLTQQVLQSHLSYDPLTGIFTWLNGSFAGKPAGCVTGTLPNGGYHAIRFNHHTYRAHRLAWLYMYGEFPSKCIDHINRDRTDNRISNLRLADDALNSKNQTIYKNSPTGYHGVTAHGKRWRARININGKKRHLGVFDTIEEAAACRRKVELELGFHEMHGNYKSLTTIPQGSTSQANGDGNGKDL